MDLQWNTSIHAQAKLHNIISQLIQHVWHLLVKIRQI